MTSAARKLTAVARPAAIGEDDPLWQKLLAAPFDPNPTPEHEALALAEAGAFVDGATVTAEIARRARKTRAAQRLAD